MAITSVTARLALLASVALIVPTAAVERGPFEGAARGFPVLRDIDGKQIGEGDFVQWLENGRLHVRIVYSGRTRRIEENAVFRQSPELAQEQWSLQETRDGKLYRQFAVNFESLTATAKKLEDGELKNWSDDVKVDAGRAFAGFGFTLATKALRARLMRGEHVELQTVGFTPKPRAVTVEVSYGGLDRVPMGGRTLRGERYVVHPKLPLIAELFVKVPDAQIWLTSPAPAAFLRWEGPLAEPSDPITRVDLLPGGASGSATPVGTSGRRD